MSKIPKTGELYKDDNNQIFQIVAVAVQEETGDQLVIYQAMFGDFGVYARPLRQFIGENDGPNLFEELERTEERQNLDSMRSSQILERQPENETFLQSEPEQDVLHKQERSECAPKMTVRPRTQSPAESKRAFRQSTAETNGERAYYEKRRRQMEEREQRREMFRKSERRESATEELRANPCLMKFLEADTYEEKYHVLNEIQNDMTDRLIDDIAVVLDVVIPEGALNDRFHQLRNIILTRQKYETNRFR